MTGSVPSANPETSPCPRCRKPLIDPKGLGWCRACGYCRSLEDTPQQAAAPVQQSQPNQVTATGAAIAQMPIWFWVMLLGCAGMVGANFAAGRFLTLSPFQRALFTTVEIGVSVGVLFLAQFFALLRIAPEDASLSFKDAVFPFRLYGLIFKRLPATSWTVVFVSWAIAAAVAAGIFIGGTGHWFNYLPGNQKTQPNQAQKTKAR